MKEKCTKYEALFTFASQEEFEKHLKECPDCQREHEKMQQVSELIKEAKPYFIERRKNFAKIKAVAASFALIMFTAALGVINFDTDISDTIRYGTTLSAEDLGLPVDSYGLLMVE